MTYFIVKERLDAHVAFADDGINAVMMVVNVKRKMGGGNVVLHSMNGF